MCVIGFYGLNAIAEGLIGAGHRGLLVVTDYFKLKNYGSLRDYKRPVAHHRLTASYLSLRREGGCV